MSGATNVGLGPWYCRLSRGRDIDPIPPGQREDLQVTQGISADSQTEGLIATVQSEGPSLSLLRGSARNFTPKAKVSARFLSRSITC
jgi:hypothetical protein